MKKFNIFLVSVLILNLFIHVTAFGNVEISVEAIDFDLSYNETTQKDNVAIENGKLSLKQHNWVEYQLDVPETGIYNLAVLYINGSSSADATSTVAIDSNKIGTIFMPRTGNYSTYENVYLNNIHLNKGYARIRFRMDIGSVYFKSFQLTLQQTAERQTSDLITIQSQFYSSGFDYSATKMRISAEGEESISIAVNDWADYIVNVDRAGSYKMRFTGANGSSSATTAQFSTIVNEVEQGSFGLPFTGGWSTYETVEAVNITLNKGFNKIRIKGTQGNCFFQKLTLEFLAEGTSSEMMEFQTKYYHKGYDASKASQNYLDFQLDAGQYASFGGTDVLELNVIVNEEGIYDLSLYTGNNSAINVSLFIRGTEVGQAAINSTGGLMTFVPTKLNNAIYLKKGINILRFEHKSGGSGYFLKIGLEKVMPEISIYSGENKLTELIVTDGSMSVKGEKINELLKGKNVLFGFAIYKIENGNQQLYKLAVSEQVVSETTVFQESISNIVTEPDSTYYMKVILWDSMKPIAFEYDFGS